MKTTTNLAVSTMEPSIVVDADKTNEDKTTDREFGDALHWLPCSLALDIPVIKFTVGDLLRLTRGSIVETAYHQSSDLPLRVNGQLVGWTEFEVVGERLAVRLTDLS